MATVMMDLTLNTVTMMVGIAVDLMFLVSKSDSNFWIVETEKKKEEKLQLKS